MHLRKLGLFFLVIAVSVPVWGSLSAAPVELLTNGDFESGTSNWQTFGGQISQIASPVYTGNFAASYTSTDYKTKWFYQDMSVNPVGFYSFSGWAFKNNPNISEVKLRISWYSESTGYGNSQASGPEIYSTTSNALTSNSAMFKFMTTGQVQAPSKAIIARLKILLVPASGGSATAYFDNFSFINSGIATLPSETSPASGGETNEDSDSTNIPSTKATPLTSIPTPIPVPSPTVARTKTPARTVTPRVTPTPTFKPVPTPRPLRTPTIPPMRTIAPTITPSVGPLVTPSPTILNIGITTLIPVDMPIPVVPTPTPDKILSPIVSSVTLIPPLDSSTYPPADILANNISRNSELAGVESNGDEDSNTFQKKDIAFDAQFILTPATAAPLSVLFLSDDSISRLSAIPGSAFTTPVSEKNHTSFSNTDINPPSTTPSADASASSFSLTQSSPVGGLAVALASLGAASVVLGLLLKKWT